MNQVLEHVETKQRERGKEIEMEAVAMQGTERGPVVRPPGGTLGPLLLSVNLEQVT